MQRMTIADEVMTALREGRPVVALESTLVAHGLPHPAGIETALGSESAVREAGAVPATIAVIGGSPHIGLGPNEIERLALSGTFRKAGRRDLGPVLAGNLDAATTVSATLRLARLAGIGVMATGGLGGVHRGAAETFDISTDIDELARADGMIVVCSGAKSILDLSATLEVLETRGVVVIGYRTSELPAFTTPSSGLPLEWRADTPAEIAATVGSHRALGLPGAVVVAQAVPAGLGLSAEIVEPIIAEALEEARRRGVTGKPMTPFLLDRVRAATSGAALRANTALIVANARLAGETAVAISNVR